MSGFWGCSGGRGEGAGPVSCVWWVPGQGPPTRRQLTLQWPANVSNRRPGSRFTHQDTFTDFCVQKFTKRAAEIPPQRAPVPTSCLGHYSWGAETPGPLWWEVSTNSAEIEELSCQGASISLVHGCTHFCCRCWFFILMHSLYCAVKSTGLLYILYLSVCTFLTMSVYACEELGGKSAGRYIWSFNLLQGINFTAHCPNQTTLLTFNQRQNQVGLLSCCVQVNGTFLHQKSFLLPLFFKVFFLLLQSLAVVTGSGRSEWMSCIAWPVLVSDLFQSNPLLWLNYFFFFRNRVM